MSVPFEDRIEAGRLLGKALGGYAQRSDIIVFALPRGGVPVAYEVACILDASMDLMLVRKLGTPDDEELAMGAIASGEVAILNLEVIARLGISDEAIEAIALRERRELERRERIYRGNRAMPDLRNRCLILVDDGIATGATVRAVITALRELQPAHIVVATPLAPTATVARLRREADEVVCLESPEPFVAISRWYRHFPEVSDGEVRQILARAWAQHSARAFSF